jgi:hypothetical protein
MNLNEKLKGLPYIYYLNLDERLDRRNYTEEQYEKYKIKNFERFSSSKYQFQNFNEWKDTVILNDYSYLKRWRHHVVEISISILILDAIRHWLISSNDSYFLLMEDDYDLSYIDHWHFDWEYLMNNIPFDWDCIQLSFENDKIIPCYLHPICSGHSTGASLIQRSYAEKLIKLLYVDGKYDLSQKISNWKRSIGLNIPNLTGDYFLGHCGRTYCIPLISTNPEYGSYSFNYKRNDREDLTFTRKAYDKWWTKFRDKFTLEEFFMFGKPNDLVMTIENIDTL